MYPADDAKTREQLLEERRAAERALQASAAQMQGVITAAVDGIIAINDHGIIQWVNPAAVRLFGYSPGEMIGHNVSMLMPEPDQSHHDQYLANYIGTGQAKIIGIGREVVGRRKDGSLFPMELAVGEVKLEDGRMFTGIVRDITQHKEAQRALIQAKEAAESANRSKDLFLAMVSHELRTPLNPILSAVTYLEHAPDLPEDIREEVAAVRRNVEHEARLVDDLLSLTRLSRGKIELHFEAVDTHTLLRHVLADWAAELDTKEIEVVTALRAKECYIWADPGRITQVLGNLLNNALKFTGPGGRVSVRTSNPEAGRFRIEVIDTGIGIDPEVLKRLFTPFEQGERTVTRRYAGMGLGLAIAKTIVDLHDGSISAHSEGAGRGARFVVDLATAPSVPEGAQWGKRGVSGKVLLVEDHPDTLRIMSKLLRAMGYEVTAATNVTDALQLAEGQHFDILVSDIGLPDGSGLDIMRTLRERSGIQGVAVSGYSQPEDITRSREAGFTDHLIKPVNVHKLENVLKHMAH